MAQQPRTIKTESRKSYQCGFALTESELRRLHDVLVQQIKRTSIGDGFLTKYEVKYRNGSVAEPTSLDQVLSEENFGSAGITRLRMEVSDKEEDASNKIGILFCNQDEE